MISKLFHVLAITFVLAALVATYNATPANALSTRSRHHSHLNRQISHHDAIARRAKRSGTSRRCKQRPSNSTSSAVIVSASASGGFKVASSPAPASAPTTSKAAGAPAQSTHKAAAAPSSSKAPASAPAPTSAPSSNNNGSKKVGLAWPNGETTDLQFYATDSVGWCVTCLLRDSYSTLTVTRVGSTRGAPTRPIRTTSTGSSSCLCFGVPSRSTPSSLRSRPVLPSTFWRSTREFSWGFVSMSCVDCMPFCTDPTRRGSPTLIQAMPHSCGSSTSSPNALLATRPVRRLLARTRMDSPGWTTSSRLAMVVARWDYILYYTHHEPISSCVVRSTSCVFTGMT